MKIRFLIIQNVFLILGIWAINRYFDFKLAYNQINSWKEGNPVIDGEGISGTFFGIPLNLNYDEGIHYSDVLGYANSLLILGVLLLVGSIVLLFKVYKVKN
ncbi:hypothetical protein [Ammoniphilus sp. 3BR4]|uniref:hypothetical protein n=1 Tax=Ammoniphilus sp. 3BR4 TaxID=3158265 RepID=UPI003465B539